jgi:hypothetical protein
MVQGKWVGVFAMGLVLTAMFLAGCSGGDDGLGGGGGRDCSPRSSSLVIDVQNTSQYDAKVVVTREFNGETEFKKSFGLMSGGTSAMFYFFNLPSKEPYPHVYIRAEFFDAGGNSVGTGTTDIVAWPRSVCVGLMTSGIKEGQNN